MAYKNLNNTQTCGKLNLQDLNANRPLQSRPPPCLWKPIYPTEQEKHTRRRLNKPSIKITSNPLPTISKTSKNSLILKFLPHLNLFAIMDATFAFIYTVCINNKVLLCSLSIISSYLTYVNISFVIYSSSSNYFHSYSNTLLPTLLNF